MPMSPEARQAQSERMKARHEANRVEAARRAAGSLGDGTKLEDEFADMLVEPADARSQPVMATAGADSLSRSELFRARMAAQPLVTTHDDLSSELVEQAGMLDPENTPGVEHTSAGLIWLYKQETWGWHRRRFSRNSLTELLVAGLLPYCGDCGSPKCAGLPNECPQGRKYFYRICPVNGCNGGNPKKFFDIGFSEQEALPSDDPFAIHDEVYAASTPETRTKAMLDAHIRAYHEQEAMARGLFNIQAGQVAS